MNDLYVTCKKPVGLAMTLLNKINILLRYENALDKGPLRLY